jgi:hypothetical protein
MAGGCAKIARFDAGATLVDVNRAQPYFSKNYREPSLIILIGLDQDEGQWCEKIFIDGWGWLTIKLSDKFGCLGF